LKRNIYQIERKDERRKDIYFAQTVWNEDEMVKFAINLGVCRGAELVEAFAAPFK